MNLYIDYTYAKYLLSIGVKVINISLTEKN